MFEVRNHHDDVVFKHEVKAICKIQADYLHEKNPKLQYTVWEIKQVYTTQTFDEALKS